MKIHNVEQGSEAWMKLRAGIPTASEFGQMLTDKMEPRKGEMPKTFVYRKLAEAWLGGPLPSFGSSFMMEQGKVVEAEARPFYEMHTNQVIRTVGFITDDDGKVGCSPDGLINDGGIEIKCPEAQTHVKYLLNGVLPDDYAPQVYGSMFVTGAPWWMFMSYRRHFPPFITMVQRDELIMAKIADALGEFHYQFQKGWDRLVNENGGPPTHKQIPTP